MAVVIPITNPPLEDMEKTALSRPATVGASVLNVFSGLGYAINQFLILGTYGEENAELVRIHNTTAPTASQITLFTGTRFAHSPNAPVRRILHDQWRIRRSDDGGATFVLEATIDVRPDHHQTVYVSPASAVARFRVSSFNSITGVEGAQSDAIAAVGLDFASLGAVLDRVYDLYNDPAQKFIKSDLSLINYLNEGYLDLWVRMTGLGKGYGVKRTGTTLDPDIDLINGRSLYPFLSDMLRPIKIALDYDGSGNFVRARKFDLLLIDDPNAFSEGEPKHALHHDQIEINPVPKGSAGRMRVWYVFTPAPLTSITERLRLPAANLTTAILVNYCMARVYEKAFKSERASYFLQAYENGVMAWLSAISVRSQETEFIHSFADGWESGSEVIY